MNWRKSSYSSDQGGDCIETANDAGVILVRDSTNRDGGTLTVGAGAWQRFADSLK